jgi:hypothetical protein
LIAGALITGAFAWATWPTAGQINIESCSPDGLFATLSAAVHGTTFWRAQLTDVSRRRESAENWDQNQADIQARIDDIARQSEENLNAIRKRYPSLALPAPTDAQLAAKRLRALANKIEADEANHTVSEVMRKRAPVLKQCEETIVARLPVAQ